MKAVLLSIRPKWCKEIANLRKTVEIRKTVPNLEVPFKCYIYCTKAPKKLITIFRDGEESMTEKSITERPSLSHGMALVCQMI